MLLRLPKLDERLMAAAEMFPPCYMGADIGSDHGRLPLHLLASEKAERMVVSDISEPALQKARTLLTRHGYDKRARFVQADGLEALQEPVQAVALMGMGGDTLRVILEASPKRLMGADLILSPHTELPLMRQALPGFDYRIDRELIASSGGRFYVVMRAVPGRSEYSEKELLLGPALMRDRPPLYGEYLGWRLRVAQKALASLNASGRDEWRAGGLTRLVNYIREECPWL